VVAGQNPAEITKFCYVDLGYLSARNDFTSLNWREIVHSYGTENRYNQEV